MYEKVYSTLEFDKVKEKAAFFAVTNKAKEEIISSTPIKNERILKETLDKTEEALKTITEPKHRSTMIMMSIGRSTPARKRTRSGLLTKLPTADVLLTLFSFALFTFVFAI